MDAKRVIRVLRDHQLELEAAGILRLRLFGSVARGEGSQQSDIDLLVDFDKSKRLTLVTVGHLQSQLADLLGAKVDLSSSEWMREPVSAKAMREAVVAF